MTCAFFRTRMSIPLTNIGQMKFIGWTIAEWDASKMYMQLHHQMFPHNGQYECVLLNGLQLYRFVLDTDIANTYSGLLNRTCFVLY